MARDHRPTLGTASGPYHRHHNAKETFSRIDHELFWVLWAWAKRTFPRRGRIGLVKEFFNGGRPWRFGIKEGEAGKPVELRHAAEVAIVRHLPVQSGRSFYDGDWRYWATRLGRYPGLPTRIGGLLKRQNGKCAICKGAIAVKERVMIAKGMQQQEGSPQTRTILLHERCDDKLSDKAVRENPFRAEPSVARCMETCTPGFEANHIP